MSHRANQLAEGLRAFKEEIIIFIDNCSNENWQKLCPGEQWTVGVVTRHVAAGHFGALDLAKMIVAGEALPDLSMDTINEMNTQHAAEHADCTKEEVLGILREQASSFAAFVAGLHDADLDRTAHLSVVGGHISTQKFIENVIIKSGGEHLANMKAATGVR